MAKKAQYDDFDLTPFGRMMRNLRTRESLSQVAVARAANVSSGYIGLIETGKRGTAPSLDVVKRLAYAVHATFEETEALLRAAGCLQPWETLRVHGQATTQEVIMADPLLDREWKEILLSIYARAARPPKRRRRPS